MEAIGWRARPALAVTSLAMAAALPARVHAAPTYTKEMVGNICKSTADSLVTMGQATSYFADRYIGEGQKSFTDDTFTFCKVILKFKGPKIVFNPNWQAELAADERQRTTAIQTILAGRCANFGASLHNETFEARSGSARPASFCENNGTVYFMYTDYTVDGASLHRLNIAEPKALIGFAGPRTIWNTIKVELPEGFQRSEFLQEKGFLDFVVHRKDLRSEIARLIDYCAG